MTNVEILNKAKYVLYPYLNKSYNETYEIDSIIKLPIVKDNGNILYSNMPDHNDHHFTTYYHYKYVLPLLDNLFHFGYNINDFKYVLHNTKYGDLSFLKPKKEFEFNVTCFETKFNGPMTFDEINPIVNSFPSYRNLYKFKHSCSRIINNNIDTDKKLFISGDSQSIADISILACYYKEVWYFDNRTAKSIDWMTMYKDKVIHFADNYKDVYFDDVLVQLYNNPLWWYTEINLM